MCQRICPRLYLCSYPCPIGRNGMETLANFYFFGSEKAINWLKNKISKIEEKLKENVKHCLK